MRETQKSIGTFGLVTYGQATPARLLARAHEKMGELFLEVTASPAVPPDRIVERAADVAIVIFRLADLLGFDLAAITDTRRLAAADRSAAACIVFANQSLADLLFAALISRPINPGYCGRILAFLMRAAEDLGGDLGEAIDETMGRHRA